MSKGLFSSSDKVNAIYNYIIDMDKKLLSVEAKQESTSKDIAYIKDRLCNHGEMKEDMDKRIKELENYKSRSQGAIAVIVVVLIPTLIVLIGLFIKS